MTKYDVGVLKPGMRVHVNGLEATIISVFEPEWTERGLFRKELQSVDVRFDNGQQALSFLAESIHLI